MGRSVTQLAELARPFPDRLVKRLPGGGDKDYVEHAAVRQRLLEVLGGYSFTVDDVIRDHQGAIVGVWATLTVDVDGTRRVVREPGQSDSPNASLKTHASDAFKRCAMNLGCGLHLWADWYFLDKALEKQVDA